MTAKKILMLFVSVYLLFLLPFWVNAIDEKAGPPLPSDSSSSDISNPGFKINVGGITPTDTTRISWNSSEELIQNTLWLIIEKLITAFGVLSLLVMTIWAGFMIIYHGQDELLSRWKSIFSYGLISLAVALSAWFLVKPTSLLLYWA